MNKLTTTLAGFALVAAASVAPAFAQGNFTTNGPFTFSFTPADSFTVTSIPVLYNPLGSAPSMGSLTLTGGTGTAPVFSGVDLTFTEGTFTLTDTIPLATVVEVSPGVYSIASVGTSALGDSFDLTGGTTSSPVPEASTVLSFGALLALGGLAVLRRKAVVSNAA